MRRAGLPLPDHPHHFFQLFAQALVGMEPARGIHEHRIDAARQPSVDGIERDGCRIGALPRARATVVVLPVPFTPNTSTTVGAPPSARASGAAAGPSCSTTICSSVA